MQSNRELKSKLRDIRQKVDDVNQIVDNELDNANTKVEVLTNETQRLKQKALKSEVKYISLMSENDKLRDDITQLKSDNIYHNTQVSRLRKENDQLNEVFKSMQYSIDSLKQKNKKLNNELETAKIERDISHSLRQQLSESRRNNDHLLSQLKEMRSSKTDLEVAQTCLRNSDQKIESLKEENARLSLALSKATSDNLKLKSKKRLLKSKVAELNCEIQQLKNRNSSSIRLLSNLQTENDELKESLGHSNNLLSQVFDDRRKQRYSFDDDISSDLSSEEPFDPSLPCIIQSIDELKKSVNCVTDYQVQSQLKKLASKLEKVARGALIKSKY